MSNPERDFCPTCSGRDFLIVDGQEQNCPNPDCQQGTVIVKQEAPATKGMIAEYEIRLIVTRPIDPEDTDLGLYLNQQAKTALEKDVLSCLKRLEGDCDCEVMIAAAKEE